MASVKRVSSNLGLPAAKRPKSAVAGSSQQLDNAPVMLNPADCNLDFNIHDSGIYGDALCDEGFAYCWSGARANVGITGGKYCFGCKIICDQPVVMQDTPLDQQHVCRIGISRGEDSVGNLGETDHSYGFGGTGKFSSARKFSDYGERFGVGDTIICAVDLESKPSASIGFSKNGQWLGIAKHIDAGPTGLRVVGSTTWELKEKSALFPHILLKNVGVQMQFSIEDGLVPLEGYKPWADAVGDGNALIGPSFSDPTDCELIMMVGLPASGKTTWAEKWVKEHPEKHYMLLGTNLALDQMKVPGLLRKHNYGERFELLMDRATKIFNTLLSRAAKTPRNYIIDQTNVYKSARKRKLKPFAMYHKIAVVVFPNPEELKIRSQKRMEEMGKEVPAEAINEMIANFTLPMSKDMPGTDEYFDVLIFPELNRDASQRYLDEMKCALSSFANFRDKNSSSFSRQGSLQSNAGSYPCHLAGSKYMDNCPPMPDQGTSLVTGGNLQGFSGSHLPNYYYQHPQQMPASDLGPRQSGRLESFPVAHRGSIDPFPRDSYQWAYSGYGIDLPPRNDPSLYGVHGYDPQSRHCPDSRITNLAGGAEQRQGYWPGAYTTNPTAARAEFQPPRQTTFQQPPPSGPYGTAYGAVSSAPYGSHPWNGSSMGGSFYRTPRPRYY